MNTAIKNAGHLLSQTFREWSEDQVPTRAGSLAYATVFSLAPTLVIAMGVAGLVFGADAVRGELSRQLAGLVGPTAAQAIEDMTANASKPSNGILASIIGGVALVFGATGVFAELHSALNAIWKAKPKETNGIVEFVKTRFLSFTMVLGIGFLLLVSLVISAGIAALGTVVGRYIPGRELLLQVINQLISLGIVTVLFALIYKVLPDRKIGWKDVWLGAAVTALLFNLGKLAISYYIGKTSIASSYGAAGSLAVLLIWVYYSAMILFLGAEFTQVYAHQHGTLRDTSSTPNEGQLPSTSSTATSGSWRPAPRSG